MMKILLLGASGSIGEQTLEVIAANPNDFELIGFSLGKRIHKIDCILQQFPHVKYICVQRKEDYDSLSLKYPHIHFFYGDNGLLEIIDLSKPTMMVNALVGFVGFLPTVQALKNDVDVALANKESLVVGGEIINQILKTSTSKIYPIDSEHVALMKCLKGNKRNVRRLILTASGGAFRNLSRVQLEDVTKEEALNHPSWSMGEKITIDCATMMNKGFELIEAYYLFNTPMHKIDIVLHDESKVHSLIECNDGTFIADIGPSDMRIPISYALYKGQRTVNHKSSLSLKEFMTFHFHEFDETRYPCVSFAKKALRQKGTMLTVLNASNEEAVYAFLRGEISFLMIEKIIEKCMGSHRIIDNPTIDDIVYVDKMIREQVHQMIKEKKI